MLKTSLKHILSAKTNMDRLVFSPSPKAFEFILEESVFVVKRKQMGGCCCDLDDWQFESTGSASSSFTHFSFNIAIDVVLEVWVGHCLSPKQRNVELAKP